MPVTRLSRRRALALAVCSLAAVVAYLFWKIRSCMSPRMPPPGSLTTGVTFSASPRITTSMLTPSKLRRVSLHREDGPDIRPRYRDSEQDQGEPAEIQKGSRPRDRRGRRALSMPLSTNCAAWAALIMSTSRSPATSVTPHLNPCHEGRWDVPACAPRHVPTTSGAPRHDEQRRE